MFECLRKLYKLQHAADRYYIGDYHQGPVSWREKSVQENPLLNSRLDVLLRPKSQLQNCSGPVSGDLTPCFNPINHYLHEAMALTTSRKGNSI